MTTITIRSFIDDGIRMYEVTYRFDGQVYKREWFPFLRSALRDIEGYWEDRANALYWADKESYFAGDCS